MVLFQIIFFVCFFNHVRVNASNTVNWFSVDPTLIKNKKGKKRLPSLQEIKDDIRLESINGLKHSETIAGISFKNESKELLSHFRELVTRVDFNHFKIHETVSDFSNYKIKSNCEKVQCAVESIFGEVLGNKLLYLKKNYGFNGSDISFYDSSRLKLHEINSLITAVESFPSYLFSNDQNQQITKFRRGFILRRHMKSMVSAYYRASDESISFYDRWSIARSQDRERTVFHELAHHISEYFRPFLGQNLSEDKRWRSLSGWQSRGRYSDGSRRWIATKKDSFTSQIGAMNPLEDFAESMVAYRYNPQLLKKVSLEKYQLIKEVIFDGLEYTDESSCKGSCSYTALFEESLKNDLENVRDFSEEEYQMTLQICLRNVTSFYLRLSWFYEYFSRCINRALVKIYLTKLIDKNVSQFRYPELMKYRIISPKTQIPITIDLPQVNPDFVAKLLDQESYDLFKKFQKDRSLCRQLFKIEDL